MNADRDMDRGANRSARGRAREPIYNFIGNRGVSRMKKHILLIDPDYYTRFPPIGLLKLSTYFKNKGYTVELIKSCKFPEKRPDVAFVTSLFTWAWKPVWRAVRYYKMWYPDVDIWLGGIYASILPDHAKKSGADRIYEGVCGKVEDLVPDYSLTPDWQSSIIFSTRGCRRRCGFCVVPKVEGQLSHIRRSISKYVLPNHKGITFFDNNFLMNPYKDEIFDELRNIGKPVDFHGIDARLITESVAEHLGSIPLNKKIGIRLAYDDRSQRNAVKRAIERMHNNGIRNRTVLVYALYNYVETPDEFLERVTDILNWGAVCYPMRYEPLTALYKNRHVSLNWTEEQLNSVQKARRVLGFGGTFPPYDGLINKLTKAGGFDEAFKLE